MKTLPCARVMLLVLLLPALLLLLAPRGGDAAVVTGVCVMDKTCARGTCCAVSTWIKGLRVCTPMPRMSERCIPGLKKVPYQGLRYSSSCPCRSPLSCLPTASGTGKYSCQLP